MALGLRLRTKLGLGLAGLGLEFAGLGLGFSVLGLAGLSKVLLGWGSWVWIRVCLVSVNWVRVRVCWVRTILVQAYLG